MSEPNQQQESSPDGTRGDRRAINFGHEGFDDGSDLSPVAASADLIHLVQEAAKNQTHRAIACPASDEEEEQGDLNILTSPSKSLFPDATPVLEGVVRLWRNCESREALPGVGTSLEHLADFALLFRRVLDRGPCGISYYAAEDVPGAPDETSEEGAVRTASIYNSKLGSISGHVPGDLKGLSEKEVMWKHYPVPADHEKAMAAIASLGKGWRAYVGLFEMTPEQQTNGKTLTQIRARLVEAKGKAIGEAEYATFLSEGWCVLGGETVEMDADVRPHAATLVGLWDALGAEGFKTCLETGWSGEGRKRVGLAPQLAAVAQRLLEILERVGPGPFAEYLNDGRTVVGGERLTLHKKIVKWVTQELTYEAPPEGGDLAEWLAGMDDEGRSGPAGRLSFALEPSEADLRKYQLWKPVRVDPVVPKASPTGFFQEISKHVTAIEDGLARIRGRDPVAVAALEHARKAFGGIILASRTMDAYLSNEHHHPVAYFRPVGLSEEEIRAILVQLDEVRLDNEREMRNLGAESAGLTPEFLRKLATTERTTRAAFRNGMKAIGEEVARGQGITDPEVIKSCADGAMGVARYVSPQFLHDVAVAIAAREAKIAPGAITKASETGRKSTNGSILAKENGILAEIQDDIRTGRAVQYPLAANGPYLKAYDEESTGGLEGLRRKVLLFGDLTVCGYKGKELIRAYEATRTLRKLCDLVKRAAQSATANQAHGGRALLAEAAETAAQGQGETTAKKRKMHFTHFAHLVAPLMDLSKELASCRNADERQEVARALERMARSEIGYEGSQFIMHSGDTWNFWTFPWRGGTIRLGITTTAPSKEFSQELEQIGTNPDGLQPEAPQAKTEKYEYTAFVPQFLPEEVPEGPVRKAGYLGVTSIGLERPPEKE